eukprot:751172-Hanusia_phi.AAC.13
METVLVQADHLGRYPLHLLRIIIQHRHFDDRPDLDLSECNVSGNKQERKLNLSKISGILYIPVLLSTPTFSLMRFRSDFLSCASLSAAFASALWSLSTKRSKWRSKSKLREYLTHISSCVPKSSTRCFPTFRPAIPSGAKQISPGHACGMCESIFTHTRLPLLLALLEQALEPASSSSLSTVTSKSKPASSM